MSRWLAVGIILTALLGCGDPGTGGSGVPSGSSAQGSTNSGTTTTGTAAQGTAGSNNAPASDLNSAAATAVAPSPGLTVQSLAGAIQSINLAVSPPRISIADQVFDVSTATVFASDGTALALSILQVGQSVTVQFAPALANVSDALPRISRIDLP